MKRTILFLALALLLAIFIQPNLASDINRKERSPKNADENMIITNENVSLGTCKSKAIICIDAGNGGADAGFQVDDKKTEKDINLDLAKKIGEYLSKMGYHIVYTRTDDNINAYESEDDSAKERIAIAKNQKSDYLISLQLNSDEDTLTKGYSIFTQQNDKMIHLGNQIDKNLELINYSQFKGLDSDHYSNFTILSDTDLTTVMIELGYITNSEDYNKLTDDSFQNKIALAIAEAFLDTIN